METIFSLIGAIGLLIAAFLLWQKSQQQPIVAYHDTHTRSGYVSPTSPLVAPSRDNSSHWGGQEGSFEDDDGAIAPETLAAWAAADAADNTQPSVIKPSWGKTLYDALGITQAATPDQIRTAYREQCRIWHPDQNDDPDAANEFSIVANAYKILTTQRGQYDAGLSIASEI